MKKLSFPVTNGPLGLLLAEFITPTPGDVAILCMWTRHTLNCAINFPSASGIHGVFDILDGVFCTPLAEPDANGVSGISVAFDIVRGVVRNAHIESAGEPAEDWLCTKDRISWLSGSGFGIGPW
jgi:hypothetical protein